MSVGIKYNHQPKSRDLKWFVPWGLFLQSFDYFSEVLFSVISLRRRVKPYHPHMAYKLQRNRRRVLLS